MDKEAEGNSGEVVDFVPPKGFVPPEGTAAGKPFDLVCTFETAKDGKICLIKLGDIEMPRASKEKYAETSKPDYSEYSQGIMGGMQQSMGMAEE